MRKKDRIYHAKHGKNDASLYVNPFGTCGPKYFLTWKNRSLNGCTWLQANDDNDAIRQVVEFFEKVKE